MQEQPLVSVIIPVYNTEKYLRQCLDSVVNQTLKDIEIICVDDGSIDNSLNILKEYKEKDNRFTILTQQNQHAGVARNNGLKIAKGKYLSFLDSDDFFDLNMLKEMVDKAEKDQSDIVVCKYIVYDNQTKRLRWDVEIESRFDKFSVFSFKNMPDLLCGVCNPNAWTKLFKRDLFINNNLQFDNTICFNDFTCVITALAIADKISLIRKSFIKYRINQKFNLTNTAAVTHAFDVRLSLIKSLYSNFKRLNIYDLYEDWFIRKAKITFEPHQDEKCKSIAKQNLPNDIFDMAYKNYTPLVSIVIPTYNTKKEYVDECINSILNQTYKNIEIIFIDDCSTEVSYDYLTTISSKIKLIKNNKNLGCCENVKKGFSLATGKYIVKIDSDDYIDLKLIEKEVNVLNNNLLIGAVCCDLHRFGKHNQIIQRPKNWNMKSILNGHVEGCGYAGGMMFRSKLLKEINIDSQFRVCEDFDFHLQILEKTQIKSINEQLYHYRSHSSNTMISAKGGERVKTMKNILEKHRKIYNSQNNIQMSIKYLKKPIKKKNKYF